MAKKTKVGLQVTGLEDIALRLQKLGGDIRKVTETALKESKQEVTKNLLAVTVKENFPAKGKYSTGATKDSIDEDLTVKWTGEMAEIPVGYDLTKSGLTSIYLMYGTKGTPRHAPTAAVTGMYDAIYGKAAAAKIKKIQNKVLQDAIAERMGS